MSEVLGVAGWVLLGVCLGVWVSFCCAHRMLGKCGDEGLRERPKPLTADELQELASVDREGAVARSVPHLCEALVLEAEHELATAKPYGEGYAYASARVAGRISAALELSERWTGAIESAWRKGKK